MNRTIIIAEAGVNHNGSTDLARRLVDAAASAGADIVKFQTFSADALATPSAPKAEYQKRADSAPQSQHEMLKALELGPEAHIDLRDYCAACGVEFLSTPFDLDSLAFLVEEVGVRRLKIGSGDMTNAPLLLAAARSGLPIILSTGMATLDEVGEALGVLAYGYLGLDAPRRAAFAAALEDPSGKAKLHEKVTVLQCTTEYPAPPEAINLRAMDTLGKTFGLKIGLSDHSDGPAVAVAAVGRGAVVVEKHLTLDRGLPGPDHRASLEPDDFARMVSEIRMVEAALGDGSKRPSEGELMNRPVARKSLVAAREIAKGEAFSTGNLTIKRPGDGISPFLYWDVIGAPAPRAYDANELIDGVAS